MIKIVPESPSKLLSVDGEGPAVPLASIYVFAALRIRND
jgi:hypothetical protein